MIALLLVVACCMVPAREPWTQPEWGPPRKERKIVDTGFPEEELGRAHHLAWPGATLELLEHRVIMSCERGLRDVRGRMRVRWDDGEVVESRGDRPLVRSRGMVFTFDCAPDGCIPLARVAESSNPVPRAPSMLDWWAIETEDAQYDPVPDCDTVAERRRRYPS